MVYCVIFQYSYDKPPLVAPKKKLTSTRQASNLQPIPLSTEPAYQRHHEWTFDQVIKLTKVKLIQIRDRVMSPVIYCCQAPYAVLQRM